MEPRDLALIQRLESEDEELRELWAEHGRLERELASLDEQRFLTPDEQVRRRQLQKAKLAGRDRIEEILGAHR